MQLMNWSCQHDLAPFARWWQVSDNSSMRCTAMRITPQPSRSPEGTIWGWYLPPVYCILWYCINSITGDGLWFMVFHHYVHPQIDVKTPRNWLDPSPCLLSNTWKQDENSNWSMSNRDPAGLSCGHQLWLGLNWAWNDWPCQAVLKVLDIGQSWWGALDLLEKKHLVKEDYF